MSQTLPPGLNRTAEAFGATVNIARDGISLFYVVGRTDATVGLVHAAGGQVVIDFGDRRRLVAMMTVLQGSALGRSRDIAMCGAVNLDPARFQHVTRLLGQPPGPK